MMFRLVPFRTVPLRDRLQAARLMAVAPALLGLGLYGLALRDPVRAASSPDPIPDTKRNSSLLSDPAAAMASIANHLDRNAGSVVVAVESMPITQGDVAGVVRTLPVSFASLGPPEVFRRALDIMIRQKVMVLKAEKLHLDKDPAVVLRGKVAFERVLADAWLTQKSDAAVTDAALHARYDRDIAGRTGPAEVRARVILVSSEAEAQALIAKVRDGADFGDLARQFSKDPTASDGGDLGYVPLESISPEVGAAMFELWPGQVSSFPVNSAVGFFILRVEGRRQRATPTFDEARPKLESELRAQAARDAITSLLADIKMAPGAKPDVPIK